MKDGFIKIACASPDLKPADCEYNTEKMLALIKQAVQEQVKILCFPELSVTGYTCGDLFLQETLLESAKASVLKLAQETKEQEIVSIIGLPIAHHDKLYNCAAVIYKGEILGIVPKTHIPNYGEFYEARHFTSGKTIDIDITIGENTTAYLTASQLFCCKEFPELIFGIEICEDLWTGETPSMKLVQHGANLIFNLSASDEIIGKADYRRTIIKAKSGSLPCAYAYADAGIGESTQDLVFAGHHIIAENGSVLAESKLFQQEMIVADIDLKKIAGEKRRMNTFNTKHNDFLWNYFSMQIVDTELKRYIPKHPFVPSDKAILDNRCEEILQIQSVGLRTRLQHISGKNAVIGLSGGLDSTLALIVTVHAFDMLGLDHSGIIAVTMPCFGTTDRTYQNACRLAEAYGVTLREIRIQDSVRQHFKDISHDETQHDVVYENSQARERTQVLMDIANQSNGIVIGTGDLSELALGWATYNGDHMSMYAVNASVPKTLVRYLTAYEAAHTDGILQEVLLDILDTPVSPELLPPDENGQIAQKTEDLVGPYELHDFFLYYMLRFGFTPSKIYRIACYAFQNQYSGQEILKWQKVFYRRFFTQQFKRSCLPDAPKVGSVTLSPRGDFRMPSDASANIWLKELDKI